MSNESRQLSFLDLLNILSFLIGLDNLESNLTQTDKADLQKSLSENAERLLIEIHAHLEAQDEKIDKILKRLEEKQ